MLEFTLVIIHLTVNGISAQCSQPEQRFKPLLFTI